jgi:RNA polymerase sigma factor (TIGR02999 family)
MGTFSMTIEPDSVPDRRSHHVTRLLAGWTDGDEAALQELLPIVHGELRRLARRQMVGERPGHVLQPTALVNEAYVRLVDLKQMRWQNRAHFFAMAARLMRRILVDFARSRDYQKRGGGLQQVSFAESLAVSNEQPLDLVALDDALAVLATVDARKSRVVELRFFGGLSVEETAEILKISCETVKRDWKFAKNWLLRELGGHAQK